MLNVWSNLSKLKRVDHTQSKRSGTETLSAAVRLCNWGLDKTQRMAPLSGITSLSTKPL